MPITFYVRILFSCAALLFGLSAAADSEIIMGLGEQRLLKVPSLVKFAVGGPQLRAHYEPRSGLLVKALAAGQTDIVLFLKNGTSEVRTFRIENSDGPSLPGPLIKALSRLTQTSVFITAKGAILKGSPTDFTELQRISSLVRGFENQVFDETTPPEGFLQNIQSQIEKLLGEARLPCSLELQRYSSQLVLTGDCANLQARAGIFKKIQTIYPLIQSEIEVLTTQVPTVHFKVYLLQIRRTAMSSLGIDWPGQFQNALQISQSGIKGRFGVDLSVNALEGQGKLRVLSRPELVVRAPGEAELFAGGELPLRIKTHNQNQVHWRQFGVRLKLKVEQSAGPKVRLDISTEVSDLDHQIALDEIPGIQSNKMNTQVDAQYGKPLFLSGLLKESQRSGQQGLPVLSRMPVIGGLFGTNTAQEEETEIVAVLVPGKMPPQISMQRFTHLMPDGPMPAPRNHLTPAQEQDVRDDPNYPWNVL